LDSNEIRRSDETMLVYGPAQDWAHTNYMNYIYARSRAPVAVLNRINGDIPALVPACAFQFSSGQELFVLWEKVFNEVLFEY